VPDDRQALEALGAVCPSSDVPRLLELEEVLGKRERNSWLLALGRTGDPRCLPVLTATLQRMAVDPARGFAERRLSALGLGRMGLPSLGSVLLRAYRREREEEGHPGAGLGVQYPVRAVLVWALGECQVSSATSLLCSLLDERSGTAFGGLYLPAMGALLKLGEAARPELERVTGPGADQARLLLAQLS
jgi:HEAT repeat protein